VIAATQHEAPSTKRLTYAHRRGRWTDFSAPGQALRRRAQAFDRDRIFCTPKKWAAEKFPSCRPGYVVFSALLTVLSTESVHNGNSVFEPLVLGSTVKKVP
jgi:hypothetical protein